MSYFFLIASFFQDAFKQIILGIIQGLTEFLPISSTAHLIIIPKLLGWGDPGVSAIASIQLGSLIAVFIYFWKDLRVIMYGLSHLIVSGNRNLPESRLSLSILIGNIPIVFVGLFIKLFWPAYESSFLRAPYFIAIISVVMSLILFLSEKFGQRIRDLRNLKVNDGLVIGMSQVLALIPGVSRSGITISTSLLVGLDRSSSARFSFLLGVPAIFLSGIVEIPNAFSDLSLVSLFLLLIGISSASITSYFCIDLLIKYLKKYSLNVFIFYRISFGFFVLFLFYKGYFL